MKNPIYLYLLIGLLLCSIRTAFGQDTAKDKSKIPPPEIVYAMYDEPPVPPGGQAGFIEFLKKNLIYPKEAIAAKASGMVYVSIVIGKDGLLSDIHVEKDNVGYGCGEEAVRVIKKMGPWKPGKMNGTPVKVRYLIRVKFVLP